jgi:hypothetical protein
LPFALPCQKRRSSSSNSFPPLKECYNITFKRATPNETISTPPERNEEWNSKGQNMKRRTINVYMGGRRIKTINQNFHASKTHMARIMKLFEE